MSFNPENSPFAILGIDESATDDDVRKAYRRQGIKYHPDTNQDENAERMFKRIQMAYQMLKNEDDRRRIIRILNVYRKAASSRATPAFNWADMQRDVVFEQDYPASGLESAFHGTSGFLAGLLVALLAAARLERVPFKMLFFWPFIWYLHTEFQPVEENAGDLLIASFWQAGAGALSADLVIHMARTMNRHHLRAMIDRIVGCVLLLSIVLLFGTISSQGQAVFSIVGSHYAHIRAVTSIFLGIVLYHWFVLSFLFNKHHRLWEGLLVMVGISWAMYFLFIVIY